MCKKNEKVFKMQIKNENDFAVKKSETFQSIVFSEIKNLLHLCLKKLFALFFFRMYFSKFLNQLFLFFRRRIVLI